MSTGVIDGQPVNAATTNAAFLGKNGDDSTTHKLGLLDADPVSGSSIDNLQRELNAILSALGMSPNQIATFKLTWASDAIGSANDTVKARIEALVTAIQAKAAAADLTAHASSTTSVHGIVDTSALATKTGAETLANKTLTAPVIDVQTLTDQGATPSSPSAGSTKVYTKTDGKLYKLSSAGTETEVGSGGGSGQGGVNFLILDTSWGATKTTNSDAETSIGDWAAYADAAGTSPVDMTGGTPDTSIARSTTSPLNGVAHFEMAVSSGATRQGEGVSCTANLPPAYRGRTMTFSFPFSLTGTVVDGDFTLYAYDVTNSEVITPFQAGKILGSAGIAMATFTPKNTCTQLRVGIHIARASNTGAVTIKFDDVKLGIEQAAMGLAGTNTSSDLTFTPNNFGTVASKSVQSWQLGDRRFVSGSFVAGSSAASTASITLPYNIDTTKEGATTLIKGIGYWSRTSSSENLNGTNADGIILYDSSTPGTVYFSGASSSNLYTKLNGSSLASSGQAISFKFDYPESGRDANVTMAQSSKFNISSYLANGTRVTGSAPTKLGEYRSYLRNSSGTGSSGFTETNGAPTDAPSTTNGIRIYNGNGFSSADTSSNPTRYEIFVGKNKNVFWEFYASSVRTGQVDVSPIQGSSTASYGYNKGYDPSTGIAWISPCYNTGSETSHTSGRANVGDANDIYFDIIVSENALAVGVESGQSARYNSSTSAATSGNSVDMLYTVKVKDTHGTFNTSTGEFTAQEVGRFAVKAAVSGSWGASASNRIILKLYKNGTFYSTLDSRWQVNSSSVAVASGSDTIDLVPGDKIKIVLTNSLSQTWTADGSSTDNYLDIQRVSF